MSINRAILLGHVGADPEIRRTKEGDPVASFRLATSEFYTDKESGEKKEKTQWHTIVVFNRNLTEIVEKHVKKGSKVSVEGMIMHRTWEKEDGGKGYATEIVVGRFDGRISLEGQPQGAGTRRDEHGYGETRTRQPAGEQTGAAPRRNGLDDDIPF